MRGQPAAASGPSPTTRLADADSPRRKALRRRVFQRASRRRSPACRCCRRSAPVSRGRAAVDRRPAGRAVFGARRRTSKPPANGRTAGVVGVADRQRRGLRGAAGRDGSASSQLVNMNDLALTDLAAARDVLVITSTFGDGGPPDNGATSGIGSIRRTRPRWTASATRCWASATARTTTSAATPSPSTPGSRHWARRGCSSAPNARSTTTSRWTDGPTRSPRCSADRPSRRRRMAVAAASRPSPGPRRVAEPFTRAKPILAPLSRNVVLTAPTSRKEVRQFGFDISEYDVSYAAGDSLGVYATNSPATVDAWLAATGLRGDTSVEVDGDEQTLRDALIVSYDICRVTPEPAALRRGEQPRRQGTARAEGQARQVAGRPQRTRHRAGVRRARRPRAVAGGAGAADAAELLDLVEPAGQPARGAADGVGGALPRRRRRPARRRVLDVPGRPRRGGAGVPAALTALPAARRRRTRR